MEFVRNIRDYFNKYFEKIEIINFWGYYSKPPWIRGDLTSQEQVEKDLNNSINKANKSLSNRL